MYSGEMSLEGIDGSVREGMKCRTVQRKCHVCIGRNGIRVNTQINEQIITRKGLSYSRRTPFPGQTSNGRYKEVGPCKHGLCVFPEFCM